MRDINEIIVHCTATQEGKDYTVNDIRSWHLQRGWADIGYHYVVYRDGSIHDGRPVEQAGSHVAGRNAKTIGIVYVGGVDSRMNPKDTRTNAQKESLLKLLTMLMARFPTIAKISGHRDYAAKACPSFDATAEYRFLTLPKYVAPTAVGKATVRVSSTLNLRSTPGGAVIMSLSNGAKLDVMGGDSAWYKVKTTEGVEGWVSRQYVEVG